MYRNEGTRLDIVYVYKGFVVYLKNKTETRRKMFITKANVAS